MRRASDLPRRRSFSPRFSGRGVIIAIAIAVFVVIVFGRGFAQFYADVEGHPDDQAMKWAFEELDFFTTEWSVLGTYPASPFRG